VPLKVGWLQPDDILPSRCFSPPMAPPCWAVQATRWAEATAPKMR